MGGNTLVKCALLLCLWSAAQAIPSYQQCLNCFYTNPSMYYYCSSSKTCLPIKSTQCNVTARVYNNYQCLNGYQDCTNVTFTPTSVGQSLQFSFGLNPGNGCYVKIDRQVMGSYGTMQLQFDDPQSIMVFDKFDNNYQSGDVLGMPLSNDGWAPRKVLVANKGSQQAGFSVTFVGGLLSQQLSLLLLAGFSALILNL